VCCLPDESARFGKCAEYFQYEQRNEFTEHLKLQHDLEEVKNKQEFDHILEQSSISSHNMPRFWCGFCKATREQKLDVGNAFHPSSLHTPNRFSHINNHFDEGLKADDWVCYTNHQTKRENREEKEKHKEKWKRSHDSGDSFSTVPAMYRTEPPTVTVTLPDEMEKARSSRKRKNSNETRTWHCVSQPYLAAWNNWLTSKQCQCNFGPQLVELHGTCSTGLGSCEHERCSSCDTGQNTFGQKKARHHEKEHSAEDSVAHAVHV
jgi:hypothetical protein